MTTEEARAAGANRRTGKAGTKAAPPSWECFVFPDSGGDVAPGGQEIFLTTGGDGFEPPAVEVRLSLTARVRPLNLIRKGGKWLLVFDLENPGPHSEALLAVECGEGGAPSMEGAASLLFEAEAS